MNANVYGNIGTLQRIKEIINGSKISNYYGYKFTTLNDLNIFFSETNENQLRRTRNEVVKSIEDGIKKYENDLLEISKLRHSIEIKGQNTKGSILGILSQWYLTYQLSTLLHKQENIKKEIQRLSNGYDFIIDKAVKEKMNDFEEEKIIFSNMILPLKAGYEGEIAVLNNLKSLPSSFYIINDFSIELSRPIFDRKTESYISTVQIDHIVIGQNGIFCIETKNWLKNSIEYYNPIKQNIRHALVLYIILTRFLDRKISVKNIIAANIQLDLKSDNLFAKVLKYNELSGYILNYRNGNIVLNKEEVVLIKNNLLEIRSTGYFQV